MDSCESLLGAVAGCYQIHRLILVSGLKSAAYAIFLITSKVLDARRRGAIEGNAADDALLVDQGCLFALSL
jgi:hypothetical protein